MSFPVSFNALPAIASQPNDFTHCASAVSSSPSPTLPLMWLGEEKTLITKTGPALLDIKISVSRASLS